MYDGTTATLAATGTTLSLASFIWWPMAIFALLAVGIALLRIGWKRAQITPESPTPPPSSPAPPTKQVP